jgi:hypothetical protein
MKSTCIKPMFLVLAGAALALTIQSSSGHPRYNSTPPGGNCAACHGDFDGPVSPQGSIFPSNSKHEMHRASTQMDTDCLMCHTNTGDNPFTYSSASNGFGGGPGSGCAGCHGGNYGGAHAEGVGLRKHHLLHGVTDCLTCHPDDPSPLPENIFPPYYGSTGTNAFDPCNPFFPADTWGESFSLDDNLGLDNDGDGFYDDVQDPDCGACPWDCGGTPNGVVNTVDFLALLQQWGTTGGSCDFGNNGVNSVDFLALLQHWGPCP